MNPEKLGIYVQASLICIQRGGCNQLLTQNITMLRCTEGRLGKSIILLHTVAGLIGTPRALSIVKVDSKDIFP